MSLAKERFLVSSSYPYYFLSVVCNEVEFIRTSVGKFVTRVKIRFAYWIYQAEFVRITTKT